MKKILILVLALALVFMVVGCNDNKTNETTSSEISSETSSVSSEVSSSDVSSENEASSETSSEPEEIKTKPTVEVLARYTFDNDSGNTVIDSSKNGFNGTIIGSPVIGEDGKNGKGIKLNGTNGFSIPVDAGKVGKKFTVSAWFKIEPGSAQRPYRIISTGCWGPNTTGFLLALDTSYGRGGIIYCVGKSAGDPYWNRQNEFSIVSRDGKWHHIAISFDLENTMAVGYVDGELCDLMFLDGDVDASPMAALSSLCVGGFNDNGIISEGFIGSLDDVVILNGFLDEDGIGYLVDNTLFE